MIAPKLLLSVAEAGEVLSVGRTTVYTLLASGELESVHIGRARRIPAEALREYVAGLRAAGRDEAPVANRESDVWPRFATVATRSAGGGR